MTGERLARAILDADFRDCRDDPLVARFAEVLAEALDACEKRVRLRCLAPVEHAIASYGQDWRCRALLVILKRVQNRIKEGWPD